MSIKNLLRNTVYRSATNDSIYRFFWHPLIRLTQLAARQQAWKDLAPGEELLTAQRNISEDLRVRSGPFAGLKYPEVVARGSAFYPKLLGSYEQELHTALTESLSFKPDLVLDIGCAEGYYAVGLARLITSGRVLAYDIDARSRACCLKMAEQNAVDSRVEIRTTCNRDDLIRFNNQRLFVLSDCEGFENQLFDSETMQALSHSVLLVETHDFITPFTTRRLRKLFSGTHHVEVIRSVPDMVRPTVFPNPIVSHLTVEVQIALMAETRPSEMQWLWCRPRLTK